MPFARSVPRLSRSATASMWARTSAAAMVLASTPCVGPMRAASATRSDRTGPTSAGRVEWKTAAIRVAETPIGSTKTRSASVMPRCGCASLVLEILTVTAAWLSAAASPGRPVSGARPAMSRTLVGVSVVVGVSAGVESAVGSAVTSGSSLLPQAATVATATTVIAATAASDLRVGRKCTGDLGVVDVPTGFRPLAADRRRARVTGQAGISA